MKTEHEVGAIDWESGDIDCQDEAHKHFTKLDLPHWTEIADEGERLMDLALEDDRPFDLAVEDCTPIGGIICGVAAAAHHAAYAAVASVLGLDPKDFESAIEELTDMGGTKPKPMSFAELQAKMAEWKQLQADIDAELETAALVLP